ncbi:GPI mannosyltransferase 2 isoform X1 [Iris pallida]|uniref:GPI mannosyltransferase 2 isoform X1 n=1 Tax=Iris pallida TaxID=29817 RepID=A0AAX6E1R8_IRIPA|nr:GPI mannosyltransferase 2 isoform X1 [Iris pallida]
MPWPIPTVRRYSRTAVGGGRRSHRAEHRVGLSTLCARRSAATSRSSHTRSPPSFPSPSWPSLTQGPDGGITASRYCYMGGFDATRRFAEQFQKQAHEYGVPAMIQDDDMMRMSLSLFL